MRRSTSCGSRSIKGSKMDRGAQKHRPLPRQSAIASHTKPLDTASDVDALGRWPSDVLHGASSTWSLVARCEVRLPSLHYRQLRSIELDALLEELEEKGVGLFGKPTINIPMLLARFG